MSYAHAPRISLSYIDVSGVIAEWSQKCAQMVVYEHPMDTGCSTTHVHVLMLGCQVKEESLKRQLYKMLPTESRKGNDIWAWEHKKWKEAHKDVQYNINMATYMSKGSLRPVFVKNVPDPEIEELRLKWSKPTTGPSQEKYDEWKALKSSGVKFFADKRPTLDSVRSYTMKWYRDRDNGRLPCVGAYKRNAASLYLCLIDKKEEESPSEYSAFCALEEVKNLWY